MKEGAYSFINQNPASTVECILVDLSMSCGIVSLQFDLLVNQSYLELYVDQNMQKMVNIYSITTTPSMPDYWANVYFKKNFNH
jgi:hypothetical protein